MHEVYRSNHDWLDEIEERAEKEGGSGWAARSIVVQICRTDVPRLCKEVRRYRELVKKTREMWLEYLSGVDEVPDTREWMQRVAELLKELES